MNKIQDIEELLHQAAPRSPSVSSSTIEQIHARIINSTQPMGRFAYIALSGYSLLVLLGCLCLMVSMCIPWWIIAASFVGNIALVFVFRWLVSAMV